MARKKSIDAQRRRIEPVIAETGGDDTRDRFVLHGGMDNLAPAVPDEPEGGGLDIEDTLRNLGPERLRTRVHRVTEF